MTRTQELEDGRESVIDGDGRISRTAGDDGKRR
jgi:hypothetical protein